MVGGSLEGTILLKISSPILKWNLSIRPISPLEPLRIRTGLPETGSPESLSEEVILLLLAVAVVPISRYCITLLTILEDHHPMSLMLSAWALCFNLLKIPEFPYGIIYR